MFSKTTVASSTNTPIIKDIASRVIKFKVYPKIHIIAKAVIKEVGIAIKTINEFLKLLKNKSITKETKIMAIIKSVTTEFTASDRKSTRLNSSHVRISYAVFCLKKKKKKKKTKYN